jgi:PBP1b-binding outer membrane lipoprotein LpoB
MKILILILALFLTGCESLDIKKSSTEEFIAVQDNIQVIDLPEPIMSLGDAKIKKLLQDF